MCDLSLTSEFDLGYYFLVSGLVSIVYLMVHLVIVFMIRLVLQRRLKIILRLTGTWVRRNKDKRFWWLTGTECLYVERS